METKTVERNWGLDLLRILAAFTVVMLHVSPQAYLDVEIASAPWNVMNAITGLCCWNVSAFFMLSGAFLLAPQKAMSTRTLYRKNIARLAAAFVFWSAVYALTYCLLRGKGKWTFLNELLRGHYHMWFVFTLISLYAVVPLLRKITESKKATEYFLLIGFLFTYLIGRALNFALLFDWPHKDVLQSLQSACAQLNPYRGLTALYAFVLGHYLMAYPLPKAARRLLYAAGCLSCLMTIWLTRWHSAALQATSSVFTSGASLGVLTMTAALFVFFKELRLTPGAKAQRALLLVSKCTFGVYLVHALVLERLDIAFPVAAGALLLSIVGVSLLVFLASLAISVAMSRIPGLKKVISTNRALPPNPPNISMGLGTAPRFFGYGKLRKIARVSRTLMLCRLWRRSRRAQPALYQPQRRTGVQIQPRDFPAHEPIERRAADHRRVVRAKNRRRHHQTKPRLLAFVVHRVAQAAVARHAARQRDGLRARFDGGQHRLVAQQLHRRALEAGGDVGGGHVLPVLA